MREMCVGLMQINIVLSLKLRIYFAPLTRVHILVERLLKSLSVRPHTCTTS
jgi:hypothetical protein